MTSLATLSLFVIPAEAGIQRLSTANAGHPLFGYGHELLRIDNACLN
jgi:hypothetical protein